MSGHKKNFDMIGAMREEVEYMLNTAVNNYGLDQCAVEFILKKRHYIIDETNTDKDLYTNVSYGHKYSHDKIRDSDGKIQCPYCPFRFDNGSTFSMHITKRHKENAGRIGDRKKCPLCNDTFDTLADVANHKKMIHTTAEIECLFDGCEYKSKTIGGCISHYGRKHLSEMRDGGVCLVCNTECNGSSIHYHIARCCPQSHYHMK
jgi:uncharacterized C2H2 Zn-finger protein